MTSLETNTRLKQIKLAWNGVTDVGAKAVATMMKKNNTLVGLDFDGNRYTSAGLADLADALNKNAGLKVVQFGDSQSIKSRLQFVRMMIHTENPEKPRTDTVLCFSKDKNNDVIELLLKEWRLCRYEGKDLINLPREKIDKFKRFNRYSEAEMQETYYDVKEFLQK